MWCSKKSEALPTLDGVSASCVVVPHGAAGSTAKRGGSSTMSARGPFGSWLDFLCARFKHIAASEWQQRFDAGLVFDAGGHPLQADAPCVPGTRVYYYRAWHDEPALPVGEQVLYQDAHLLVVDKPHFMPVTPSGRYVQRSLLVRLKKSLGLPHLSPLHRLDRETAGLVLFAIQPEARNAYQALFRQHAVEKTYEAVAAFDPALSLPCVRRSRLQAEERFFRSHEVTGEPNSETHIALLQRSGEHALYRLTPRTGQRHQLRVHMCALGLPIEGDQFYPEVLRGPEEEDDHARPLQLLAKALSFVDPLTGAQHRFVSQQRLRMSLA